MLLGLLLKAEVEGTMSGIKLSRGRPNFNHLLFVDDLVRFGRENIRECDGLKQLVEKYVCGRDRRLIKISHRFI